MGKLMRGKVMSGIGQGVGVAGSQILNAVMTKQRLDIEKQKAASQTAKNQSDMKRNDAYTNYLDNQNIMKQVMDLHAEVPAWLARKQAQQASGGPGSTANQLATNYGLDAVGTVPASALPSRALPESKGTMQPIPALQPADPRVLLNPESQPLYAEEE